MLGLRIIETWLVALTPDPDGQMGKVHKCESAYESGDEVPSPVWYVEKWNNGHSRYFQIHRTEAQAYIANSVNDSFTI